MKLIRVENADRVADDFSENAWRTGIYIFNKGRWNNSGQTSCWGQLKKKGGIEFFEMPLKVSVKEWGNTRAKCRRTQKPREVSQKKWKFSLQENSKTWGQGIFLWITKMIVERYYK